MKLSFFHSHNFVAHYGGLYADEPHGPRTMHEIWWECACGAVRDKAARDRAMKADREEGLIQ